MTRVQLSLLVFMTLDKALSGSVLSIFLSSSQCQTPLSMATRQQQKNWNGQAVHEVNRTAHHGKEDLQPLHTIHMCSKYVSLF